MPILIPLVWVQPGNEPSALCEWDHAQPLQQKSQVSTRVDGNTRVISVLSVSQSPQFNSSFLWFYRTKALVLELLAAVCLVRGGHDIILSAFDNFREVKWVWTLTSSVLIWLCLDAHSVNAFAANFRFNDSSRETSSTPHMQSGHKSKHMSCGFKKYSAEKCSIEETVVIYNDCTHS